jgi:hypothetical protein
LASGGAIAATAFGLPAVGQSSPPSSPIILGNTGKIIDKGAAAVVTVRVVCFAGDPAGAQVALNERSGNGIAQGVNSEDFNCTGAIQTLHITVPAASKPFKRGTAFGQSVLVDFATFQTSFANRNVKLS